MFTKFPLVCFSGDQRFTVVTIITKCVNNFPKHKEIEEFSLAAEYYIKRQVLSFLRCIFGLQTSSLTLAERGKYIYHENSIPILRVEC